MYVKFCIYLVSKIVSILKLVFILKQGMNGDAFDGSAAFDAIAEQEQRKSVTPSKSAKKSMDINYKINTSDGNP